MRAGAWCSGPSLDVAGNPTPSLSCTPGPSRSLLVGEPERRDPSLRYCQYTLFICVTGARSPGAALGCDAEGGTEFCEWLQCRQTDPNSESWEKVGAFTHPPGEMHEARPQLRGRFWSLSPGLLPPETGPGWRFRRRCRLRQAPREQACSGRPPGPATLLKDRQNHSHGAGCSPGWRGSRWDARHHFPGWRVVPGVQNGAGASGPWKQAQARSSLQTRQLGVISSQRPLGDPLRSA